MQKVKLPLTVDPVKDAQRRLDYDGYYAINQLTRLNESVSKVLSDAQVRLSFFIDPQKLVVMKGQASVEVELICQRCEKPFVQMIDCTFVTVQWLIWIKPMYCPKFMNQSNLTRLGK